MSSDPVILACLGTVCHEDLQLFEQVTMVCDGKDGIECQLCLGKHFIFFVSRGMDKLVKGAERLSYLDIDKAVSDTATNFFFILELNRQRDATWTNCTRLTVQSEHRELLLERIGICWQSEVMYRNFEVRKFQQAKAAIATLLPWVQKMMHNNIDLLQVTPFKGYDKEDFVYRGYGFWLREGFKSVSGLKDGFFQNDLGWETSYDGEVVVVPAGMVIMVHVDDEQQIMEVDEGSTGMDDLRTVAMEYQRSLTQNLDQFYVVVSGPYMKMMNRNGDAAAWEGWEFFIRSKEYAFACVIFRRLYIPPLCTTSQDLAVVMRCPASELDQDACEVLLDECRFVADSMSSTCMPKTLYPIMLQARLDALQFTENGYRHTEGQLGLAPQIKQRAAVKFVKSIVQLLDDAGALQDETLINAEVFAGIPIMIDPIMVAQELLSDAEAMFGSSIGEGTRKERQNAYYWRLSRYLAYCVDGGILGERFNLVLVVQAIGRGSMETDIILKAVIEFLLHLRPRKEIKDRSHPAKRLMELLQDPEEFANYSFNESVMRVLLAENFIASEWKKRKDAGLSEYESLLAVLLTNEFMGVSLRMMICRQVLDSLASSQQKMGDRDPGAFERAMQVLVPALVKVMRTSSNLSLVSYAVAALVNVSAGKTNMKLMLVQEGVLKLCIQQLKTKNDDLTLYTLLLLVNLSKISHHRFIFVKEGGVFVLVDILTSSYQNLRKQKILAEASSVIGQLCNDPDTRSQMSESFPVVPCLLWVFDSAQHNTKLKPNLMFALRQLCQLGQNKMKVGHHITSSLLNDLKVASAAHEECATNLLLLLISLASVNTNALMMDTKIDDALSFCGIQGTDGVQVKSSKLAQRLWPKVMALKTRIKDAKLSQGEC